MFIFRGLVRATSNLCRSSFCYGWMFRCARINCDAETHTITRWSWRVYRLTVRNIDTRKDNGWPSSEYVESTTHWLCSQSTDVSTDWMTDSIAFAHVRKINIRLPVRNKCRDKAEKNAPSRIADEKKRKREKILFLYYLLLLFIPSSQWYYCSNARLPNMCRLVELSFSLCQFRGTFWINCIGHEHGDRCMLVPSRQRPSSQCRNEWIIRVRRIKWHILFWKLCAT